MRTKVQFIILILSIVGCDQKEMPLDYHSVIGTYKASHKEGNEELILNSDYSYIYKFYYPDGEIFRKSGYWEFNEEEGIVDFIEWQMLVFPSFLTKEKYIQNEKYWGRNIDPDEDIIVPRYPMNFTTVWVPFKRVYVLRRNFDLHGFDLIKVD